jgi:hypothetical protein
MAGGPEPHAVVQPEAEEASAATGREPDLQQPKPKPKSRAIAPTATPGMKSIFIVCVFACAILFVVTASCFARMRKAKKEVDAIKAKQLKKA